MAEPDEPEEMVEVEVDLTEGLGKDPMSETIAAVPAIADMPLDMTKDEKLRTTALMMAVRYHADTVVKEGELYQQMKMDQKQLRPTSAEIVVGYAWEFEQYLRGESEVVERLEKALFDRIEERLAREMEEDEQRTNAPGYSPDA